MLGYALGCVLVIVGGGVVAALAGYETGPDGKRRLSALAVAAMFGQGVAFLFLLMIILIVAIHGSE